MEVHDDRLIFNDLPTAQRCEVLDAKEAKDKYILSVHTKNHVSLIKDIGSKQFDSRRNWIASKFSFIYLNEWSSEDAYVSAGSTLEDKPCDICGDAGFAESISTCFNCQIAREHIYCMKVLLKEVPEMWFCESCRSSADIISPKLALKELLPVALASNSSQAAKTGTLQTVSPSKLCKEPRQSAHLVSDLFPVTLASNSTLIVKSGTSQHGCPSKLYKDPGEPVHLMKQMAVGTAKVKFKPREESDKLSFGSEQFERSLQSNSGLIPCQSGSMASIAKKTVIIKTGPTKFSLMKVEQTPRFFTSHSKTPGYANAEVYTLTQQATQTSTEFKGGTNL